MDLRGDAHGAEGVPARPGGRAVATRAVPGRCAPGGPDRLGDNGPMADLDALRSRFARALEGARGPGPGPDPAPYAENLLARWREPQRRYHTLTHLTAVLDHVDVLAEYAADPDTVRLAAWFHDAVYLPDRSENEERSARLAERALPEAGVPREKTAEVARLVRLTAGHDPADGDRDGEVLCDADLAILAAPPSAYAAYTAAVREEYHFVPSDAFRAGRAAVLRHLLDLPRLFRTPYGREKWEATARYNLTAELDLLALP
ncbi:HD domain-containing protein [Streptomyces sp. enrichment culture]|uniref:HD domain-containing protein n=1 Tax=Streptomyces sp. enrichment culture TaxID=1795815 RepID=UPI003F572AC3